VACLLALEFGSIYHAAPLNGLPVDLPLAGVDPWEPDTFEDFVFACVPEDIDSGAPPVVHSNVAAAVSETMQIKPTIPRRVRDLRLNRIKCFLRMEHVLRRRFMNHSLRAGQFIQPAIL
jgi:hypothetical protein